MFAVAFGQKKMFKNFIPAVLHLFVYLGFLIVNIEIFEFVIDGITGRHRSIDALLIPGLENSDHYNVLYNLFVNIFEFMAISVMFVCIIFLIRRNLIRVKRFKGIEMKRWPLLDANLILIFEIVLMLAILCMNAADQALQLMNDPIYIRTGIIYFSHLLIQPYMKNFSCGELVLIERTAWWTHILGILGFGIYVTYSKHLHIIMSFPNTYYSKLVPAGQINNMTEVTLEVKKILGFGDEMIDPAMNDVSTLGAKDVSDLTWKNLMEAYSCTECGRCTSVCPASLTGKKLSPRKIMMDVRDRLEEVGNSFEKSKDGLNDGKSLLHNYITKQEVFACTTCGACTEACPVNIDPVSIIIQLRRYLVMEESQGPVAWNNMFVNIETNFAPWKVPVSDRFNWADQMINPG
jgi:heterodisulfide reductase subunit C